MHDTTIKSNSCVIFNIQTHPTQNMIATGSIDSDLGIRIWVDPGQLAA